MQAMTTEGGQAAAKFWLIATAVLLLGIEWGLGGWALTSYFPGIGAFLSFADPQTGVVRWFAGVAGASCWIFVVAWRQRVQAGVTWKWPDTAASVGALVLIVGAVIGLVVVWNDTVVFVGHCNVDSTAEKTFYLGLEPKRQDSCPCNETIGHEQCVIRLDCDKSEVDKCYSEGPRQDGRKVMGVLYVLIIAGWGWLGGLLWSVLLAKLLARTKSTG